MLSESEKQSFQKFVEPAKEVAYRRQTSLVVPKVEPVGRKSAPRAPIKKLSMITDAKSTPTKRIKPSKTSSRVSDRSSSKGPPSISETRSFESSSIAEDS